MSPEVERINQSLKDSYGIDTASGLPMLRIVFSDEQREKLRTRYNDRGAEMLQEEVRELPKYQWVKGKWILENLVVIPEFNRHEMADAKVSYEPLFIFEHQRSGNPLPPRYDVCQFIIHNVEVAKGGKFNTKKYTEDPEKAKKELAAMEEFLWGNETAITDATQFGTGVFVPSNYERH